MELDPTQQAFAAKRPYSIQVGKTRVTVFAENLPGKCDLTKELGPNHPWEDSSLDEAVVHIVA